MKRKGRCVVQLYRSIVKYNRNFSWCPQEIQLEIKTEAEVSGFWHSKTLPSEGLFEELLATEGLDPYRREVALENVSRIEETEYPLFPGL
jgi:hypothetical protein